MASNNLDLRPLRSTRFRQLICTLPGQTCYWYNLIRIQLNLRFEAKRVIIRQGHKAENFYFILSGTGEDKSRHFNSTRICGNHIWIPLRSFRIKDTRFLILCQWNLDSGYQSLVGFRGIPWAVFPIAQSKFPWFQNPDSLTWVELIDFIDRLVNWLRDLLLKLELNAVLMLLYSGRYFAG